MGLFGQNMKKLKILKLSRDSRYLQKLALNEFITLLKFKFQHAAEFGNYLRFSISTVCGPKISRRTRQYSLATEMS